MHTQGKWTVRKIEDRTLTDKLYDIIGENSDGRTFICRTIQSNDENLDNVIRITQMHNSFDGLLEACKDVQSLIKARELAGKSLTISEVIILKIVELVIKKAEDNQ